MFNRQGLCRHDRYSKFTLHLKGLCGNSSRAAASSYDFGHSYILANFCYMLDERNLSAPTLVCSECDYEINGANI